MFKVDKIKFNIIYTCFSFPNFPQVDPYNQRYIVGTILSEGTSEVDKEVEARLVEHEFKLTNFPAVDHAVICSFPFIWTLSSYIATAKVWPQLGEYIEVITVSIYRHSV